MSGRNKSPGEKANNSKLTAIAGGVLCGGMALAVSAILLFGWIADEVFEGDSVRFDTAVRTYVHTFATERLTAAMQFFSFLGSTVFLVSASLLLLLLFLWKRQSRSAVVLIAVMFGAVVLNYTLKISFGRARPIPYFDTPLPDSFSFPSGHSLFSACFYGITAWLLSSAALKSRAKIVIGLAATLIIFLVGLSRIYLGVHFPTDVIAGFVAAFVWVSSVICANSIVIAWPRSSRK